MRLGLRVRVCEVTVMQSIVARERGVGKAGSVRPRAPLSNNDAFNHRTSNDSHSYLVAAYNSGNRCTE